MFHPDDIQKLRLLQILVHFPQGVDILVHPEEADLRIAHPVQTGVSDLCVKLFIVIWPVLESKAVAKDPRRYLHVLQAGLDQQGA